MKDKKINKVDLPFPAISIDDFIPSKALVRAAAESFEKMPDNEWVKYSSESGQVQYCSKAPRESTPECLLVLDYIAMHFNPGDYFDDQGKKVFPDLSHYGGGMMLTPNQQNEGGYLGMHVDAEIHGINSDWKREYSAILCISEDYDETFDLLTYDGSQTRGRMPYKFNRLNVFKCSENSWHGIETITPGKSRKTLGVMFWSKIDEEDNASTKIKAKFIKQ
jgi:hypothetical protein